MYTKHQYIILMFSVHEVIKFKGGGNTVMNTVLLFYIYRTTAK